MSTPSISTLRRRAAKLGYRVSKSNWRRDSPDNLGGYRITEVSRNLVVSGAQFDLDIEDVANFLNDEETSA